MEDAIRYVVDQPSTFQLRTPIASCLSVCLSVKAARVAGRMADLWGASPNLVVESDPQHRGNKVW